MAASYEQGEGVAKDVIKALAVYTEACDSEYIESCTVAAGLYLAGEVVAKNAEAAITLYGKALQVYVQSCKTGVDADCLEAEKLRSARDAPRGHAAADAAAVPAAAANRSSSSSETDSHREVHAHVAALARRDVEARLKQARDEEAADADARLELRRGQPPDRGPTRCRRPRTRASRPWRTPSPT